MMDIEKLFAAGGKHSRSLHAWEQERTEQLTSSMSNHSISDNSNKSLRKSKKNKEDFPDDISINSAASSSYALKHGATQKRATSTSKLSSNSTEKEPTSPSSVMYVRYKCLNVYLSSFIFPHTSSKTSYYISLLFHALSLSRIPR